ncbi:MAG: ATP-dependent DNA helicase UvrD2 [Actinobacteria bacterium]|nr:ATP-dependent DNA helicase UvrD2 [Actinomycetota bacterium]
MNTDAVFEGLNPQQREAVEAVRGPVCILAGAGSGKTTTITRRIANQVLTGAFAPTEILAVTFTDKAAGEMRARLQRLGATGVQARTFHSAALAQLRHFAGDRLGQVLPSKAMTLQPIRRSLPPPFKFRPLGDLAGEIEWAKNRRLTPDTYLRSLDGHEPPIPPDIMVSVFSRYERAKESQNRVDFEDLLELAVRLYDEDAEAARIFRARYRAFTVDEYQDVNLLQQSLLERWLGDRNDLCVVGDDYQSIYSFTGATAKHLLTMKGQVFRLEDNYRSTPEILELANRLVPKLGGAEKVLRATRPSGEQPVLRACEDSAAEVASIVGDVKTFHREGVPYEEIAVLYRINSRSEDFEEALSEAGIPYQVRGGAFLARPGARGMMRALRGSTGLSEVAGIVRQVAEAQGLTPTVPGGVGEEELTRQGDLARFVRLAEEFDDGTNTVEDFFADLEGRFGAEAHGRGVNLLTYHRAKGLEFDVVFLPRLEEGELPFKRSRASEALAEERRLLYVGMTRAKQHLEITWSGEPSRFLAELGVEAPKRAPKVAPDDPVMKALKAWRLERSKKDEIPAFVVFHDKTLEEIARRRPNDLRALSTVSGVGPAKLERYGDEVIVVLEKTP